MVYIKALKDEILDSYAETIASPLYAIGATSANSSTTITLFEKEDVIVNRIEKLPVLKGLAINFHTTPSIFDAMIASALENVQLIVRVYNGTEVRDDLIKQKSFFASVQTAGAGAVMLFVEAADDLEITTLLSNTITVRLDLGSDDTVAGANFAADTISVRIIAEIDWVKVTKEELSEYAVEQLYVAM